MALAQRVFDEGKFSRIVLIAKGHTQELLKAFAYIVLKPVALKSSGMTLSSSGMKSAQGTRASSRQAFRPDWRGSARLVQAVATEHTAHGIGQELGHGVGLQAGLSLFFGDS